MGTRTNRSDRFDRYIERLASALGHEDRAEPLRAYCTGLLLPTRRKSVEPMAAHIEPSRVSARHQSMLHFVGKSPWRDEPVLRAVRQYALPAIEERGPVEAWIIDDTGIPKRGKHSVGVANQYCGVLGKNENCQVVVTVSVANEAASLPAAHRLYLPEKWACDPERRRKVGVPEEVEFLRKWEIALSLVDGLLSKDITRGVVLADAGYGDCFAFRDGLSERGLRYVVGVQKNTKVWRPGEQPLPPPAYKGRGPRPKNLRRDEDHQPVEALALARSLPTKAFKRVTWREGTAGKLTSRFAAVRVRPSHRDFWRSEPHPEQWLLIEWPENHDEPTKYWLSNTLADIELTELVRLAKMRWRVERDYQELKQEFGLDQYEGRSWRGLHHHFTLSTAAYAFLTVERLRLSPPDHHDDTLDLPTLPDDFTPRGSSDAG